MPEGDLTKTAGAEVSFKVGDKTYSVKSPNIGDMAAFQSHIKVMRLRDYLTTMKSMDQPPDLDMQKEILNAAITQEEVEAEGSTLAGMQYIMYRCLRHNPGVTLESMDEIVTAANLSEVDALIGSLGGAVENPPPTPKPKTQKRTTVKKA